jgi:GR25 family glycosyltransferase involved in LPS biosynthesis
MEIKAKIIHVPGIALSKRLAQECIVQAKKFRIDVELFNGINGLEYQSHLAQLGIQPLKKFKKNRPGVYGCFLSHYYLWRECADQQDAYLILEHDGWFVRDLPEDVLNQFDHVLKLDSLDPYSKNYERTLAAQSADPTVIKTIAPVEGMNNGAGDYSWGTYAYIIKPQAAQLLIDWIQEHGFLPADQQVGLDVCDVNTIVPTVARLHPYFYHEANSPKTDSLTTHTELLS